MKSQLFHCRAAPGPWIWPLLLLLAVPAALQAQFNYVLKNGGTIAITGYTGPGGAVTIPGMIDGFLVTSIGDSAFYRSGSLTSVTIPDSVTNIGAYAFSYCTSLINVAIPNSVISIGQYSFSECSGLTSAVIPDGSIGVQAFFHCTILTNVIIGSGVTSIGDGAFAQVLRPNQCHDS